MRKITMARLNSFSWLSIVLPKGRKSGQCIMGTVLHAT